LPMKKNEAEKGSPSLQPKDVYCRKEPVVPTGERSLTYDRGEEKGNPRNWQGNTPIPWKKESLGPKGKPQSSSSEGQLRQHEGKGLEGARKKKGRCFVADEKQIGPHQKNHGGEGACLAKRGPRDHVPKHQHLGKKIQPIWTE